jgi:hypothetical protein
MASGSVADSLEHPGFVEDFRWAFAALRSQPSVVLVSLVATQGYAAFGMVGASHSLAALLLLPVELAWFALSLGWLGSERIFFLRRFDGETVSLGHLLRLTPAFAGRFFRLGLVVAIPAYVFILWGMLHAGEPFVAPPTALLVACGVFMLAVDFGLTFVTPPLAYTTRSVNRALDIGFALIRETWPRSALYVLCPPLALSVVNLLVAPANLPVVTQLVAGVLVIVGLLAKGSIATFYLRERGARDDDGAARRST